MSAAIPVLLERDNVNDESVTLVRWCAEHGSKVEVETLLAEVETSKANVEVYAQAAGYLQWAFPAGANVPVFAPIAYIAEEPLSGNALQAPDATAGKVPAASHQSSGSNGIGASASASPAAAAPYPASASPDSQAFTFRTPLRQRFSPLAESMMREHGLKPDHFAGKGLIRKQDVLNLLNPLARSAAEMPAKPTRMASRIAQPYQEIPLDKRKRFEASGLAAGVANAVSSSVSVTCFTRGLRQQLKSHPIETGNLSAVIIYEVSHLLRKYPTLNATYCDGSMLQFEQVNLGFALDDGRGLKVAVFQNADQMSLQQTADELLALTKAYVQNKLTPEQTSNATITISDLSGLEVSAFCPIISENQGSILGIASEQRAPDSTYGFYTMTLTFDHQLSDGRIAGRFLNDLKKRLQTYESALFPS